MAQAGLFHYLVVEEGEVHEQLLHHKSLQIQQTAHTWKFTCYTSSTHTLYCYLAEMEVGEAGQHFDLVEEEEKKLH